jgi:hypothetical protein
MRNKTLLLVAGCITTITDLPRNTNGLITRGQNSINVKNMLKLLISDLNLIGEYPAEERDEFDKLLEVMALLKPDPDLEKNLSKLSISLGKIQAYLRITSINADLARSACTAASAPPPAQGVPGPESATTTTGAATTGTGLVGPTHSHIELYNAREAKVEPADKD